LLSKNAQGVCKLRRRRTTSRRRRRREALFAIENAPTHSPEPPLSRESKREVIRGVAKRSLEAKEEDEEEGALFAIRITQACANKGGRQ
jgi:hypothetical protein